MPADHLLRCLLRGQGDEDQQALSPSVSRSSESSSIGSGYGDASYPQDPYGLRHPGAWAARDTGPYKRFHVVDAASLDPNALAGDGDTRPLVRRLKALLPRRLSSVDLAGGSLISTSWRSGSTSTMAA
ncbi:hypothetical protein Zm00014a_034510 [Zea mays]|uniref:Uncharacterized protein n=1 Tax=Zea mays TaxID=4577 RepID=A0A3L6DYE3_MAIZE|nr:hypothetical protein Zm00014a_034510 [Zea mays]